MNLLKQYSGVHKRVGFLDYCYKLAKSNIINHSLCVFFIRPIFCLVLRYFSSRVIYRIIAVILTYLMVSLSFAALANNSTLYYQPKVVKLTGLIRVLTFPGPPNYESIRNGDAIETCGYLILNNPIDVDLFQNFQIGNDELEKNVKFIQLVIHNDKDWPKIKNGNAVVVSGQLFHALTGHHHARVLLLVENVAVISQVYDYKKLSITRQDREYLNNQHCIDEI